MKDILIGIAVFAIIFGGALFGMLLGKLLPDQHLSTESRDTIRTVMAMLATLSAVVLGLLTGSSIASLGEKEAELRSAGAQFIMLDQTLAEYGPETDETRTLLKQLLSERISQIWPEEDGAVSLTALSGGPGIILVQRDLFALSPQTEQQRWLRSNALEVTNTIAESRWTTIEQIGSRFPWGFFVVVVTWLTVIFASFGLYAPRNASVVAALLIAALALAGPIFMMLEMDQPYGGVVKIPSTSLRVALDQLGQS
ncbi:bestrophin-like domain [Mycobacterium sp. IDR2000157661]|uniref:bestrophin-like domain n=1 Tax=Mycobacterium sp. IDR2000157661 TaxID=2867005 RepID=UPI001EE9DB72|nr:hypothetical protein [Mycobacterium sp. IDR2000157661]ULE33457.1 hypothetical protein K3G64_01700 [Mycobacterium sp. IDR2000157661]